ncbi:putative chitinase [Hamiltosporidium tvaerminnensis]|uniref:Putative chitinase n=2 Tax=Hamiltosporidium TaxID=1176354 RepID=A0A4Q9M002_9MICR|nr:putative chitinase [Hamiltosporidium magnivora]TBU12741.1 putative chitinase [Hamiltosporidium tvaerminnensis]TBU19875.1 putative chitinase [Hamiltosporidium tvaerminnensis]
MVLNKKTKILQNGKDDRVKEDVFNNKLDDVPEEKTPEKHNFFKRFYHKLFPKKNNLITSKEIFDAISSCGFEPPNTLYVTELCRSMNDKIQNKEESAMFLAHIIHETGGLKYLEERYAVENPDFDKQIYDDGMGRKDKSYHGRGFLQITWPKNYARISNELGMGYKLLDEPELVCTDIKIAADVSACYWLLFVRPYPNVKKKYFGATTKAINGAVENGKNNVEISKNRYKIYLKVAKAFNIKKTASEKGCYN